MQLEDELLSVKRELERWLNKDLEASFKQELARYKASLKEKTEYIAKIEKSTQSARSLLQEILSFKLRYESIIYKMLQNERKGKTETISEVIKKTTKLKHEELSSLDAVLTEQRTPPKEPPTIVSPKRKFPSQRSRGVEVL
mmetsp:Transcript_25824/g.32144  ORF Transcript_25824/g.32144 Transcript_25824/m.32144 type:complete len:141 (-) Transcript_25824:135-557(-)